MTERPNQRRGRRAPTSRPNRQPSLWQPVPAPDPPEPIDAAPDATAFIASLGSPPLRGVSSSAEHYLAAVVERAAGLASALALSAQLLAQPDDDDVT